MSADGGAADRPPSVDALARRLHGLPHPLLVDAARQAIAAGDPSDVERLAQQLVDVRRRTLAPVVINATGVLLHTNLGRAPFGHEAVARPHAVELDLETGERSSRQRGVGGLLAALCGAEAAMVVNNNAAAVLLVTAALAAGRSVAVSRGESVEIGGSFRIPEVLAQSGARLVDVGTTNRTRLDDYRSAIAAGVAGGAGDDDTVAMVLKVHPSNYHVEGFVESCSVRELVSLGVPVVADLGSGLVDAACPWLDGPPPAWLQGEPAARQTLSDGAALVTFSGDKLLGGPQAGVIAGRADVVERCGRHPLARAVRPGALVVEALTTVALAYLRRDGNAIPFWRLATVPVAELRRRAEAIVAALDAGGAHGRRDLAVVASDAVCGAGSTPSTTIPSAAISVPGDVTGELRRHVVPVVARAREGRTVVDLRAVDADDDAALVEALGAALP